MATLLPLYNPEITVTCVGVVHLLRDEDAPQYAEALQQADFILAQYVADTYPCSFVRNSELVRQYGHKVIFWITLYFRGYNPELFYLRLDGRTPLRGPLGDYQSRTFFAAWKQGLSVQEALALQADPGFNQERYAAVPDESLAQLRRREENAHIAITPALERLVWSQRLFFTFNHPSLTLLQMAASALLEKAGIPATAPAQGLGSEPLGNIQPPINPWIVRTRGMADPESDRWKGFAVKDIRKGEVTIGRQRTYAPEEVVGLFFRIYAANQEILLSREWG